jgi:hypothetical protein
MAAAAAAGTIAETTDCYKAVDQDGGLWGAGSHTSGL